MSNHIQLPGAYASAGFFVRNASEHPWPKIRQGVWDPFVFELMDRLLAVPEPPTLVDLGAYVGPLALYAASLNATVYAVEADPDNFAALLGNVHANPARFRRRISTHLLAIGDETGLATLSKSTAEAGESSAISMREAVREQGGAASEAARQSWTVPSMLLPCHAMCHAMLCMPRQCTFYYGQVP